MALKKAGAATLAKLDHLGWSIADANKRKKKIDEDIAGWKAEIVELATKYELPMAEGKSEYANVSTGYVRVTRPAAPLQRIIAAKLLELIMDKNPEFGEQIFLDVVVLPQFIDVDVERWRCQVRDETVTDMMLIDALEEQRAAPKPNAQFVEGKSKKVDSGDDD